jgi:hypothetical protein
MRHIRQKLTLAPISQLSRVPRRRVFLNTIPEIKDHLKLIWVFNESISPLASTVMNRVKSPSMAAADI